MAHNFVHVARGRTTRRQPPSRRRRRRRHSQPAGPLHLYLRPQQPAASTTGQASMSVKKEVTFDDGSSATLTTLVSPCPAPSPNLFCS